MSGEARIKVDRGNVICPDCLSLTLIRTIETRRKIEWAWWCGCGWTSESHTSPSPLAVLLQRFSNWKNLNKWND